MASTLRLAMKISLNESILANSNKSAMIQFVRFRKPRWLPIAKSKEFYVREPTPIIQEEYDELKVRYRLYKSQVESVRKFLNASLSQKEVNLTQEQISDSKVDLEEMKRQVQEWNDFVLGPRTERQAQENMMKEQNVKRHVHRQTEEHTEMTNEAKKSLHLNKVATTDFIGAENLDEAIEKMLDSHRDYNYAITKTGQVLPGEYPASSQGHNSHKTN